MMAVTAGKHGLVAVGWEDQSESFDAAIWTSPDGLKWTRVPADDTADAESSRAFVLLDVIPVEEGFVAVGAEVSVDPHNGMVHVPPEPGGGLPDGMALFAGPWMFDTSGAILTSSDGSRWNRVGDEELARPEARTAQFNAVAVGGPGLVAVGWGTQRDPYVAAVWKSKDGLRWSPAADPGGALHGPRGLLMTDVVARDSGLIAVGADGTPFAVDGAVWTSP
jgi:molecular chaperone DnaK